VRVLTTQGITLEPQLASHAPAMFDLLCDPAIYEYENEPPASVEALRERFKRLESRTSPDGKQQWLNWVVRMQSRDVADEVAGYVQATVHPNGRASVAYVLGNRHWGKGIASRAVIAMIKELREHHGAGECIAILKSVNARSLRLLQGLGFKLASADEACVDIDPDEMVMILPATTSPSTR
jgi:ribosomal-protein-alanine N-acetyltransferase